MMKTLDGDLVVRSEGGAAFFQCRTRKSRAADVASEPASWQSVDLFLKKVSETPSFSWPKKSSDAHVSVEIKPQKLDDSAESLRHEFASSDFGATAAWDFLLDWLSKSSLQQETVARLVVPASRGYTVRSDIVSLRMLGCPLVATVASFPTPHQFFEGPSHIDELEQLPRVFAAAAGAMILKPINSESANTQALESALSALDTELRNRLSFPWLSKKAPQRQTLAIVDGGISSPDNGGTGTSIYGAAAALGIDMVVFDSPNHWVNSPKYSHWRKATVALECPLEPDSGFASTIVDAVRSYDGQIDGILTFRDHYKLPVAQAALRLSLPTYPPSAYEIATDKFKTSVHEGHQAYHASSADEAVELVEKHNLEFPLIIKPTNGFLSEGVFRIQDAAQLTAAAQSINTERHGKEFVIEKYCQGPEVDANFVLSDGELLFFEASDDFPKSGDANGSGTVHSFIELANVLPSKLPARELAVLRDSFHQSLVRMGFRDGFYHLEGRVENSSMEYATAANGLLDLAQHPQPSTSPPSAWLIEVNPRPPGIQAAEAIRHTYGLDYFGLGLLFALDDKDRVKRLSYPFAQGPQYWCEMVFIPVEKGGVYHSGDVCVDLFARRPDIAACVSGSFCFLRKGDEVKDPSTGINSWVAYFNIFSRESREHLLELAEVVRSEVRFSIV